MSWARSRPQSNGSAIARCRTQWIPYDPQSAFAARGRAPSWRTIVWIPAALRSPPLPANRQSRMRCRAPAGRTPVTCCRSGRSHSPNRRGGKPSRGRCRHCPRTGHAPSGVTVTMTWSCVSMLLARRGCPSGTAHRANGPWGRSPRRPRAYTGWITPHSIRLPVTP